MTDSHFGRVLSVWADFNSLDDQNRFKASLRYADTPARPATGERIRLHDDEGNAVMGIVEEIRDLIVHVRPEMATWTSAVISIDEPFARARLFHAAPPQSEPTKGGPSRAPK
jgi:hypothetical protein